MQDVQISNENEKSHSERHKNANTKKTLIFCDKNFAKVYCFTRFQFQIKSRYKKSFNINKVQILCDIFKHLYN